MENSKENMHFYIRAYRVYSDWIVDHTKVCKLIIGGQTFARCVKNLINRDVTLSRQPNFGSHPAIPVASISLPQRTRRPERGTSILDTPSANTVTGSSCWGLQALYSYPEILNAKYYGHHFRSTFRATNVALQVEIVWGAYCHLHA